ncbi:MAG TPA: glycosyltransferase, partial [Rhizomicrobium sp.]|nr:glycosyltransferase [Rhizomicrobium sp.]
LGRTLRLPAVLARSGLLERIRLTPEGTTLIEAKRLTRRMHAAGHKVFAISYHTPSLVPGNTRYVRNQSELETFLAWIEGYFEFFFTEIGGEATTPFAIRDWSLSLLTRQRTEPSSRIAVARAASDVSVVIPAYNSSATLARALDSVLAQTVQPREIVVVDDCSKDDTIKLAQSYADNGVRVVALNKQSGAAGARNAGIYAAKGEFIAFLDSDDEWLPTKLEKQMAAMETDKNLSLVSCASNLILPNGTDCGDVYGGRRPTVGPLAWKALLVSNYIATPTVVARRDHLVSLGGFDRNLKIGEDQDMWIRLALVGNVGFIFESLVRVHERENSLSNWNFDEQLLYTMPMIEKHIRQLSDRLTPVDIRRIKGERIGRLGRVAHGRGKRMKGAQMILEATLLGYRPVENFYYLITASPPITWLKFIVRRFGI